MFFFLFFPFPFGCGLQVKYADHSDIVERVQDEAMSKALISLSGAFANELKSTAGEVGKENKNKNIKNKISERKENKLKTKQN